MSRWTAPGNLRLKYEPEVPQDDPSVEIESSGGLVESLEGEEAGSFTYEHSGALLTGVEGPPGDTAYEYDGAGRMTKVTLPNGTWGSITYEATYGRVKSVTVAVNGSNAKTTYFTYSDEPRRTTVTPPGSPVTTYDIGEDGSVFKWWNVVAPPDFDDMAGTLYANRETASPISVGDHNLVTQAHSEEGIDKIEVIANGNQLVDEKTCAQDPGKAGIECVEVQNEWVTNTGNWPPGIVYIEVLITDRLGQVAAERFWVNIPYTPPPVEGEKAPAFAEVLEFRAHFGLDLDLNEDELAINDRVFDLIGDWYNPSTAAGEVARATTAAWGVPLRPSDVAELELRERYVDQASTALPQWANSAGAGGAYAGYYVDHSQGGLVYVGFTSQQPQRIEALKQSGAFGAPDRLRPFPFVPSQSYAQLVSLEASILTKSNSVAGFISSHVDVEHNRVEVRSTNVAQAQADLNAQFGSQAPIAVLQGSGGRQLMEGSTFGHSTGPVRGGERIEGTTDICSIGYGAWDRGGTRPDGSVLYRHFVLTAGHCMRIGERTYQWNIPDKAEEWERTIGYVRRTAYNAHPSGYSTDSLAIRLEDPGLAPRLIRWSPTQDVRIQGVATPKEGMIVCASGQTRGRSKCGDIDWPPDTSKWGEKFDNKNPFLTTVPYDINGKGGDSGGPIWERSTGFALGTLTGSEEDGQTNESWFTPLKEVPGYPLANGALQALEVEGQPLHVILWKP